jgi:hypothetical protein
MLLNDSKGHKNKQYNIMQKNKELKETLSNCKADVNDQWETLKSDFRREIDELGKCIWCIDSKQR